MEISMETKLEVNSYMLKNFKNKGTIGYYYTKRILEYAYEQYKAIGYIDPPRLSTYAKLLGFKTSYVGVSKAVNYFLSLEKIEAKFPDFIVDSLEGIINDSQNNLIAKQEEDEF